MLTPQGERHGCHNRKPLQEYLWVQDGYTMRKSTLRPQKDRIPRLVRIVNNNTRICQYTKERPDDPKCAGCHEHLTAQTKGTS